MEQIQNDVQVPREQLLKTKPKQPSYRIPLIMKYNRTLPTVRDIVNKYWDILKIDINIRDHFTEQLVVAFRHNKNLIDLLGSNNIENNTKKTNTSNIQKIGKCQPCFGRAGNLCCQQIKTTSTFKSDTTGKVYNIL